MGIIKIGKMGKGLLSEFKDILNGIESIKSDLSFLRELLKPKEKNHSARQTEKSNALKMQSLWNDFCKNHPHFNLRTVRDLTDKRVTGVNSRLKNKKFDIQKILDIIAISDFLLGKNDHNWKVTFDWIFLSAHNSQKIIEGQYVPEHKRRTYSDIINKIDLDGLCNLNADFRKQLAQIGIK